MRKIIIKRTDQSDLVFTGEKIATVNDQRNAGDTIIGLRLTLYHTSIETYILGITLQDSREFKPNVLYGAVSFVTIDDVREFLLSKEGRGIADLLLLLLRKALKTSFPPEETDRNYPEFLSGREYRSGSGQLSKYLRI